MKLSMSRARRKSQSSRDSLQRALNLSPGDSDESRVLTTACVGDAERSRSIRCGCDVWRLRLEDCSTWRVMSVMGLGFGIVGFGLFSVCMTTCWTVCCFLAGGFGVWFVV